MDTDEPVTDSQLQSPARISKAPLDDHVDYSRQIKARFSNVLPRGVHAKGSALRAATMIIPEYKDGKLDFKKTQRPGFGIIPGKA